MTTPTADALEQEAQARLILAEQRGLRLAIIIRTSITAFSFAWYIGAAAVDPDTAPRAATTLVLLGFTVVGLIHIAVIGTNFDRAWLKFAVYAMDSLAICSAFALVPMSRAEEVPQILAFRVYGIYFLFPLVAVACLSLSWRLVLWTGIVCCIGWWSAFLWITLPMEAVLSWGDMPLDATRADYETVFLSINFIGRGNRIEETAMLLFSAAALAVAVYRARRVFLEHVGSLFAERRERQARERISDLLGKYVPQAVAQELIEANGVLAPQRSHGTALVMDIVGFTRFSSQHPPEHVISALDAFLSEATDAIDAAGGTVMTYMGDGMLATFNAPVPCESPEVSALGAAELFKDIALHHGFEIRVGLASGTLVTGTIGSEARQSFTVYGDAVNLAARLEGMCKKLNVHLLADETTAFRVSVQALLPFSGRFPIRGFATSATVYSSAPIPTGMCNPKESHN